MVPIGSASSSSTTARTDGGRPAALPAFTCRGLTLGYGTTTVLRDVDLDLPAGQVTALMGPNGAGKSTLLNALAGLIRPQAGSLSVPARRRRGGVTLVLQATDANARLPLTVAEAVAMGRYPHRRLRDLARRRQANAADRRAIESALDVLQIRDLARSQLQEISGGQRQRALIAQGLAQEAELLLLDEPFTGLDILSRASIREAIDHEKSAGRTVILSTHDIADAAAADHVVLLAGRVVASGPAGEALTDGNLSEAYGARLVRLGEGHVLLDDPHHDHP